MRNNTSDSDPKIIDFLKTIEDTFWDAVDHKAAVIKDTHISIVELIDIFKLTNNIVKSEMIQSLKLIREDYIKIAGELITLRKENENLRSGMLPKSGCDMCEQFMKTMNEQMNRLERRCR